MNGYEDDPIFKTNFPEDLVMKLFTLCDSRNAFEPMHEKTNNLHICENKGADQLRGNCEADQRL